jgi:hypothetical protein
MRVSGVVLGLLFLVGCAVHQAPENGNGPLLPSLQASAVGDTVFFVLQVTNTSTEPVELHYRSGQSYEFVVLQGEREMWRWSADQMFTQALRHERLEPGATLRFEEAWQPPAGLRGELVAVGQLTASNRPVEQRANFRLP